MTIPPPNDPSPPADDILEQRCQLLEAFLALFTNLPDITVPLDALGEVSRERVEELAVVLGSVFLTARAHVTELQDQLVTAEQRIALLERQLAEFTRECQAGRARPTPNPFPPSSSGRGRVTRH